MPNTTQSSASDRQNEARTKVLLQVWARMTAYDGTATSQKTQFRHRRSWIVVITLMATVSAVLTGLLSKGPVAIILGIVSVVLPILGIYLMNDILQFVGTTTWIKYRYIAEAIRSHIYLYRMSAGPYAEVEFNMRDDLLIKNVAKVREEIQLEEVRPFTLQEPTDEADIKAAIKQAMTYTPDDDGLKPLTIDKFIEWRLTNQKKWYDTVITHDYARLKQSYRASQFALFIGALLGAIGIYFDVRLVALIAITNAASIAITTLSNMNMYGKTYGLFLTASLQLGEKLGAWHALQDNPEMSSEEGRLKAERQFAKEIEDVLFEERQNWYTLALQAQTNSDQTLLSNLEKLAKQTKQNG